MIKGRFKLTTKTKRSFGDTPGDRLRLIRRELNLSREEIEKRFGLSAETLKAWENGKVGLTEKGMKRCVALFRDLGILVTREWLMNGEGLDPRLGRGIEDLFRNPEASLQEDGPLPDDLELLLREVEFFKHSSPNATVMLVTGEEMLPKFAPGDYVGGRLKTAEYFEQAIGKDCIVITKAGDKYLRRVARNAPNEPYQLVCHNPLWGRTQHPVLVLNADEIDKVAPVVWHRRKED